MTEPGIDLPGFEDAVAAWNLGHRSILRPLTAGRTNDSFRLVCTRGDFVLRRLRDGKTAAALAFELDLIARLSAKGVPVAEAVATVKGDRWAEAGGRLWTLCRFTTTEPPPDRREAAHLAGEVLARFDDAVADWDVPFAPPEQDRSTLAMEELDRIDSDAVPQGLTFITRRCRGVLEGLRETLPELRTRLAPSVIHGACRTSSLLYREGRVAALLDMDSARRGPAVEDVAIALTSFAKCRAGDGAVDVDSAPALLRGYRRVRHLGAEEMAALPAYLAQALTYPLVKALGRVAQGRDRPEDFQRGAWRLAAAEHALNRSAELLQLLRQT